MKIVIDIPDNSMDYIDNYEKGSLFDIVLTNAVKNGIQLPKNHGRLIDADDLKWELTDKEWITDYYGDGLEDIINEAPTVIERSDEK